MIHVHDLIFYSVMIVLMIGVIVMGWVLYGKSFYNPFVYAIGNERKENYSEGLSDIVELPNPIDNKPMKWFDNEFTRKNFPGPGFSNEQKKNSLDYILRKRKGVLDTGAHIGDYGVSLAIALKRMNVENIPVYCIDPSEDKCNFMRKVSILHGLTDKEIKIICCGISDKESKYFVNDTNIEIRGTNTGGWNWIPNEKGVRFTTLDHLWNMGVIGEIGFFWLDAQWMEPFILKGGLKYLKHCKPYILMEYDIVTRYYSDKTTPELFFPGTYEHLKTDEKFKDVFQKLKTKFIAHKPKFADILFEIQ